MALETFAFSPHDIEMKIGLFTSNSPQVHFSNLLYFLIVKMLHVCKIILTEIRKLSVIINRKY